MYKYINNFFLFNNFPKKPNSAYFLLFEFLTEELKIFFGCVKEFSLLLDE